MSTGVIIARFQTPYLHEGHTQLIEEVSGKHKRLIVVLGVSPVACSKRNPYDFYTREKLIKAQYPDLIVLPLPDLPLDKDWSTSLDQLLQTTGPGQEFILYGSRDSFIPYYTGKNKTIELPSHKDYNATELREKYGEEIMSSVDYRAGVLYALNHQYDKVFATVDMCVMRKDKTEVLLALKNIDMKWRFVGGFSDPTDNDFEEAAVRELQEEVGPIEIGKPKYELSARVDDWRYRSENDKIITTLFSADLVFGTPKPQDDIDDVRWFGFDEIKKELDQGNCFEPHRRLFEHILVNYSK